MTLAIQLEDLHKTLATPCGLSTVSPSEWRPARYSACSARTEPADHNPPDPHDRARPTAGLLAFSARRHDGACRRFAP